VGGRWRESTGHLGSEQQHSINSALVEALPAPDLQQQFCVVHLSMLRAPQGRAQPSRQRGSC
jgi:hypothetical protein